MNQEYRGARREGMETFRGVVVVAMIREDVKKAIDNHARKIDQINQIESLIPISNSSICI
jgi:hypothetical protein